MRTDSSGQLEVIERLQDQLATTQRTLDLLVRSGRWLAWSCRVRQPLPSHPVWDWDFQDDFWQALPHWFDIERQGSENLARALGRARLDGDDVACNVRSVDALTSGVAGYSQVFRVRLRNGSISWIEENVAIQRVGDGAWHLVGICIDATERKHDEERLLRLQKELVVQNEELALRQKLQAEKLALAEANLRLKSLAATDGMTGISNYPAFQAQLKKEWRSAIRRDAPISLILADIDHFKLYNDAYGHPAGDAVLVRVARLLQETARDADYIARYGGEEFVIILPNTDAVGATAVAERLRIAIETSDWEYRGITASFGVASGPGQRSGAGDLIEEADRALYRAKRDGRNQVYGSAPAA